MIPFSDTFDQSTLARMIEHDKVIQRYRAHRSLNRLAACTPT